MKRDKKKTKVVFRKINGEVTAIFPGESNRGDGAVWSYAVTGQHGGCDLEWIEDGDIPTIDECVYIINELQELGYNLEFITKE